MKKIEIVKNAAELVGELRDIADDNAAELISDFFITAMLYSEIRSVTTDEQAVKIYRIIDLLKAAY